jgi:hypothetical protein
VRLRHQYLIAGIAWALLLGPTAALALAGFAGGVSWLWLFGDSPWPEATQWILPLIGIIGGILVALACVFVAGGYGKKREALAQVPSRREQSRVLALLITPLVLILLLGVKVWREGQEYAQAMAIATQREAAFAVLVGARHRIEGVTLDQGADGAFRAAVWLEGEREGEYRLSWRVADTGFGAELVAGEQAVRLQPGEREIDIAFSLDELVRSYQTKVLNGGGGVLVEEPFRLETSLYPVLSEAERGALPPGERKRLDTAESSLTARKSTSFPVRFIIHQDGTIER